jgi:K+-transporting ATPase ATPase C chain
VKRIANVRSLQENVLLDLVKKHTEGPLAGILGPSKINVLKLNIDLDKLSNQK